MSDRSEHINNLYDLRDEMIRLVALDGKDRDKYIQSVIFAINSLEVDEAYNLMYEETFSNWIPVTERLPEPFTFVNATCRSLVDDREDWVVETIYLPIPKETNKRGYSDWGNIPMLNWGQAEVIAWMERIIPKPYKVDSNSEKPNKSEKPTGSITLDVLKEIREEILALYRDRPLSYNHRQRTEFCDKVLFILDKKISELEGEK